MILNREYYLKPAVHIKDRLKSASIVQYTENNWVTLGTCSDGSSMNLGNFTTSAEVKALADFLNAGIKSDLKFAQISNLFEATQSMALKVDKPA